MAERESKPLPFEPKKRKKKPSEAGSSGTPPGAAAAKPTVAPRATPKETPPRDRTASKSRATLAQTRIPDAVSRRMISRILVFSGVPTFLGVSTFFISYLIVTRGWFELPNVAVVLVSMGLFGLGVLGLSYGVLSASWEEENPGTVLGWSEFQTNVQRFLGAWRAFRQRKSSNDAG